VPGMMGPTSWSERRPLVPSALATLRLDALVRDINGYLTRQHALTHVEWAPILTVRASLLGLHGQGRISANGSCRLCRTLDGWVAVNLARPDDIALVDALIGGSAGEDPWPAVERYAAGCGSAGLVAGARLLGLPVALLADPLPSSRPYEVTQLWPTGPSLNLSGLQVVDLSSMWAGPLTAMILAGAGAHVVKVESSTRPDGARGTPAFYRWLHPDISAPRPSTSPVPSVGIGSDPLSRQPTWSSRHPGLAPWNSSVSAPPPRHPGPVVFG